MHAMPPHRSRLRAFPFAGAMPPRKAAKDVAPVEETATGTYPAWSKPLSAVTAYWGVDLATGLSSSAVATRRAKYGFNELKKEAGKPLWKLVLEQFDDPLVKVRLPKADKTQQRRTARLTSIRRK